jgi:hypothetical protein
MAGFAEATTISVGTGIPVITLGDVDRDGNSDLVAAYTSPPEVAVLLGNGDGTFASALTFDGAQNPNALRLADMNNDDSTDIVAGLLTASISCLDPGTAPSWRPWSI